MPHKNWSRDPPLVTYVFTHTMAYLQGDGSVKFIELNGIEHIEIGEDWAIGEERKKEGKVSDETGFIGKGFTKYGIYMSCLTFVIKNQPITQPE